MIGITGDVPGERNARRPERRISRKTIAKRSMRRANGARWPQFNAIACGVVLVAVVAVPSLLNPRGQDVFGVVKAGLIETLGTVAGVCAALSVWFERRRIPVNSLLVVTTSVAAAFVIATLAGVAPSLSFFGSSGRHEGSFVTLALIAIALAVSTFDAEQVNVVIMAIVVGSVGPVVYEIAQAAVGSAGTGELLPRVGSTFGNPILLGGYLVMVVPVTAAVAWVGRPAGWIYWSLLTLQIAALLIARAGGAWLAGIVAVGVTGVAVAHRWSHRRRAVETFTAGCLLLAAVSGSAWLYVQYGTNVIGRTVQVRTLIWGDVSRLILARTGRSIFGFGPEMLQSIVTPFYSTDLGRLEGGLSVPDRAHNEFLDTIVGAGVTGAAAVTAAHILVWINLGALLRDDRRLRRDLAWILAIGGTFAAAAFVVHAPFWAIVLAFAAGLVAGLAIRLASVPPRSSNAPAPRLFVLGLLAACIAHFVEIQVGVATVASQLVWWCCIGITAAWCRHTDENRLRGDHAGLMVDIPLAPIGAVSVAALVFGLWEPRAGLSISTISVIAVTALVLVALARKSSATRLRATHVVVAGGIVATMATIRFAWDHVAQPSSATTVRDLVDAAIRLSHETTAALVFFTAVGVVIGSMVRGRDLLPQGRRHLAALTAVAFIAIGSTVWIARAPRADVVAEIATQLGSAGRWSEAEALEAERVRLTPENDRAWAAWGGAQLESAKRSPETLQNAGFARAASTLAEARRRNPFDWFHIRNQASLERVWAAVDRSDRPEHLAAADRFFADVAAKAPNFPTIWAEWGNVDAERGDFRAALAKLERAAALDDSRDAMVVADAIFRASGVDLRDPASRARVAAELTQQGFRSLGALYAR